MFIDKLIKIADKLDRLNDEESSDVLDDTIKLILNNNLFHSSDSGKIHKELYEKYKEQKEELEESWDKAIKSNNTEDLRAISDSYAFVCNAVSLHEMYFSDIYSEEKVSFEESDFYNIIDKEYSRGAKSFIEDLKKMSLVPRSGWVLLNFCIKTKKLYLDAIDLHSNNVISTAVPVLALDMWEHAYIIDFGLDKEKYVDWFISNINWNSIKERFECLVK